MRWCQNDENSGPNPDLGSRKVLDFIGSFGGQVYWQLYGIGYQQAVQKLSIRCGFDPASRPWADPRADFNQKG